MYSNHNQQFGMPPFSGSDPSFQPPASCSNFNFMDPQFPQYSQGYPEVPFGVYEGPARPEIKINEEERWREFSAEYKEMFVNNNGRELFPAISFTITKLLPGAIYFCGIKLIRIGDLKWKYEDGKWIEDKLASCSDLPLETPEVLTETKSGLHWMKSGIQFPKIFTIGAENKTNSKKNVSEEVVEKKKQERAARIEKQKMTMLHVHTRVKYFPCVTVYPVKEGVPATLEVPSANFITVTAYKSAACSAMKSGTNKYVRGDVKLTAKEKLKTFQNTKRSSLGSVSSGSGSGSSSSSSSANSSMALSPLNHSNELAWSPPPPHALPTQMAPMAPMAPAPVPVPAPVQAPAPFNENWNENWNPNWNCWNNNYYGDSFNSFDNSYWQSAPAMQPDFQTHQFDHFQQQ